MSRKICPYCKIDIPTIANRCSHCGSFLSFLADITHNWSNHLVIIIGTFIISISSFFVGIQINQYFDSKTSPQILKTEFESNYKTLQKLDSCVKQTRGLLESGNNKRTMMDLPNLGFTAHDLTYKSNLFNQDLTDLYSKLYGLQNRIESREQQRINLYKDMESFES